MKKNELIFNFKSPEGLQDAIKSLQKNKNNRVSFQTTELIKLFEDLLELRSEIQFTKPEKRPAKLAGVTTKILTGCGEMYVIINKDNNGNIFEVIANLGKAGGCAAGQNDAISSLITLALRCKVNPEMIIKKLKGISCTESNNDGIHSCADAIGIVLEKVIKGD